MLNWLDAGKLIEMNKDIPEHYWNFAGEINNVEGCKKSINGTGNGKQELYKDAKKPLSEVTMPKSE